MNRTPTRTSRSVVLLVLLIAATLVAIFFNAASASAGITTAPADFRPTAPDSFFNLKLRDDAPVDEMSDAWSAWTFNSVKASGGYINTGTCAMPEVWVTPDTPRQMVDIDRDPNSTTEFNDQGLQNAMMDVPITDDVTIANCSDANVAIFMKHPDGRIESWEFWKLKHLPDGTWRAQHGGRVEDVQNNRGIASPFDWRLQPPTPCYAGGCSAYSWNVTATSVNVYAGAVTERDLANGVIDHALGIAAPDAANYYVWPAQRRDGGLTAADALPEGARLRIKPSFNVQAWCDDAKPTVTGAQPASRLACMVAKAMQTHGGIVRDRTFSSWVFYTTGPRADGTNPFTPYLDGQPAYTAFGAPGGTVPGTFPWDQLQVQDTFRCTVSGGTGCTAPQTVDIKSNKAAPRVGQLVSLDTRNSVLNFPRQKVEWDFDNDGVCGGR